MMTSIPSVAENLRKAFIFFGFAAKHSVSGKKMTSFLQQRNILGRNYVLKNLLLWGWGKTHSYRLDSLSGFVEVKRISQEHKGLYFTWDNTKKRSILTPLISSRITDYFSSFLILYPTLLSKYNIYKRLSEDNPPHVRFWCPLNASEL